MKYGTPPNVEDCVDLGTVPVDVAPETLDNFGPRAGKKNLIPHYGKEVPPIRRAWLAVAYYRNADVPKPYRVKIPGLGTLIYTDRDSETDIPGDNWAII